MSRITKTDRKRSPPIRRMRPDTRGWVGRGGGRSTLMVAPDDFRGTSVQVCGMFPFSAGSGAPNVGVPLGRHLFSETTVSGDPISWFQYGNLINNPSMFLLAIPGIGKSTLIRRMLLGLCGYGVTPFVLGDIRPDYVDLIEALGGQVIHLGHGRGHLNVLDPGNAHEAARRLTGSARDRVVADAQGRRLAAAEALITIARRQAPDDRETSVLSAALRVLDERHEGVPVLGDLLRVVEDKPEHVRNVANDYGDDRRYQELTDRLVATLKGLVHGGRIGEMFSGPTSTRISHDRPVVYDISGIPEHERAMQGAALAACWANGFGAINVALELADAGLEPQRHYMVVIDELHRALQLGEGMVDRIDTLTRLNREYAVGTAMITHTMKDLLALPSAADQQKAKGFVERAGMVACGGLPMSEMPELTQVVRLSSREQSMLSDWSSPPAWNSDAGTQAEPPGRGLFLLKAGNNPGVPVKVILTEAERNINDTNRRWRVPNSDVSSKARL